MPPTPTRGGHLTFESGPVRPLALSADGTQLFIANTPAILHVTGASISLEAPVPVGVNPVAGAVRSATEVADPLPMEPLPLKTAGESLRHAPPVANAASSLRAVLP